jgi:hypothetical protein
LFYNALFVFRSNLHWLNCFFRFVVSLSHVFTLKYINIFDSITKYDSTSNTCSKMPVLVVSFVICIVHVQRCQTQALPTLPSLPAYFYFLPFCNLFFLNRCRSHTFFFRDLEKKKDIPQM